MFRRRDVIRKSRAYLFWHQMGSTGCVRRVTCDGCSSRTKQSSLTCIDGPHAPMIGEFVVLKTMVGAGTREAQAARQLLSGCVCFERAKWSKLMTLMWFFLKRG